MGQSNRLYFIDAVRAFAILMMLQGHFIETLLSSTYIDKSNIVYNIWSYFRGITAPTFFTISGLVFTYLLLLAYAKGYDKPRIKKGLYRGLILIVIGYSLRVNIFDLFTGQLNSYFLIVDVLQCIGLSLIILVGLHCIFKKSSYLFSTILLLIGLTCFITEPLYRNISLDTIPLFLANYITHANGSIFTIIPWFGYSAFGAFISTVFFRHVHRNRFKTVTIIMFFIIGGFLINYSSFFLNKISVLTKIELFKMSAYYNFLFTRLGNVLIIFSIFYTFENTLKQSLVSRIGEKTLSIYIIHFILLYGSFTGYGLTFFFKDSLTLPIAIFGVIVFTITVCLISFHYAKTNTFLYNLIRKTIDRENIDAIQK